MINKEQANLYPIDVTDNVICNIEELKALSFEPITQIDVFYKRISRLGFQTSVEKVTQIRTNVRVSVSEKNQFLICSKIHNFDQNSNLSGFFKVEEQAKRLSDCFETKVKEEVKNSIGINRISYANLKKNNALVTVGFNVLADSYFLQNFEFTVSVSDVCFDEISGLQKIHQNIYNALKIKVE